MTQERRSGGRRGKTERAGASIPQLPWQQVVNNNAPMQLFVVYSPAGPELGLRELPDFRLLPPTGK